MIFLKELSISFTLGKASSQHGANVAHNNREFIASNVHKEKISENITFTIEDPHTAYEKLFSSAVAEYNAKQSRPCRQITDYFEHISNSKREEAFYEVVVQYGDNQTAPCGSSVGEEAKKILIEYMNEFSKRNPNLYVFNSVLHMDEACPHLHINFIPFYTTGRKNGLSKGVSMKSALDEQGFTAKNAKENRLVAWEESERNHMELLLNKYGFQRDNKKATHIHMNVPEYKSSQDEKRMISTLREIKKISDENNTEMHLQKLKSKIFVLEQSNQKLITQKKSPYKSFYYSSPDKQAYVQSQLDQYNIPYRETDNGLEAQECYVDDIRKIEKTYIPPKNNEREKLRNIIDRLILQVDTFEELLKKLETEKYLIKTGKYISVKNQNNPSGNYIRLKSLGEMYTENSLRNRINSSKKFISNIESEIQKIKTENILLFSFKTIKLYTVAFKKNALPMKKINSKKPYTWNNDKELDKIFELNKILDTNTTLENLKDEFEIDDKIFKAKQETYLQAKDDLSAFLELKHHIEIIFENKIVAPEEKIKAEKALALHQNINKSNYKNINNLVASETENLQKIEHELNILQEKLSKSAEAFSLAEKIANGTYVQELVQKERDNREAKYVPNGLKN